MEGNCYNDGGIVTFLLSDNALPSVGQRTLYAGDAHQPQSNSCGVYDSKKKQTLYYNNGLVYKYKKGRKVGVLKLVPSNVSDINSQSMIYTGVKSMEIGVLDFVKKKVYLYNKKTGARTATITLPSNAVTHSVFRFAYANNYVFLYDADNRTWSGYRIFI